MENANLHIADSRQVYISNRLFSYQNVKYSGVGVKPFLVFIFGPPGSGKSTQADLVAREFNAVHFNTGEVLFRFLNDPQNAGNPKVEEERKRHSSGELNDPIFVTKIVIDEVERLHREGKSVVFSGSPRLRLEAEAELPKFQEWYPGRIFAAVIAVSELTSIQRNSSRRICRGCEEVTMAGANEEACTACGGTLTVRPDDAPLVIKKRLQIYHDRVQPTLEYFSAMGLPIMPIDGEPAPALVFESLKAELAKRL